MMSEKWSTRALHSFDELADAVGLDLLLRLEALFFFDFDLDPETLSVVSVLKALAIALHVPEAEKEVFVGASPRVVHAHRVVGGDRTVDKGVVFLGVVVAREISVDESLDRRCWVMFQRSSHCFSVSTKSTSASGRTGSKVLVSTVFGVR